MFSNSIAGNKSYAFSLKVISLHYKVLIPRNEYVLSKQFLRSSTSIGANIHEALGAYSKRDFAAKMGIAYKEARESEYWLNLLHDSHYFTDSDFEELNFQLTEICKILYSIIKSSKTP